MRPAPDGAYSTWTCVRRLDTTSATALATASASVSNSRPVGDCACMTVTKTGRSCSAMDDSFSAYCEAGRTCSLSHKCPGCTESARPSLSTRTWARPSGRDSVLGRTNWTSTMGMRDTHCRGNWAAEPRRPGGSARPTGEAAALSVAWRNSSCGAWADPQRQSRRPSRSWSCHQPQRRRSVWMPGFRSWPVARPRLRALA